MNSSTSQGYREPMHNAHHLYDIQDYNTIEVSRSEFGFNVLTFNVDGTDTLKSQRYSGTVISKSGGYAELDNVFEVTDVVRLAPFESIIESPTLAPSITVRPENDTIGLSHSQPDSIHEVQWRLSKSRTFNEEREQVFDLWGNETRSQNLLPYPLEGDQPDDEVDPTWVEGQIIDSQEGADITTVTLSNFEGVLRVGNDEAYKWVNHIYTADHVAWSEEHDLEDITEGRFDWRR